VEGCLPLSSGFSSPVPAGSNSTPLMLFDPVPVVPTSIMEAMALSVPVVARRNEGNCHLLSGMMLGDDPARGHSTRAADSPVWYRVFMSTNIIFLRYESITSFSSPIPTLPHPFVLACVRERVHVHVYVCVSVSVHVRVTAHCVHRRQQRRCQHRLRFLVRHAIGVHHCLQDAHSGRLLATTSRGRWAGKSAALLFVRCRDDRLVGSRATSSVDICAATSCENHSAPLMLPVDSTQLRVHGVTECRLQGPCTRTCPPSTRSCPGVRPRGPNQTF
jgi:hypothetical protein